MFISKKKKTVLLFIFLFVVLVLGLNIFFDSKQYMAINVQDNKQNITQLKQELEILSNVDLILNLNSNPTYYNEKENTFYYYIDETYDSKYVDFDFQIFTNKKLNYIIYDDNYNEDLGCYIDFEKPINIFLYNNNAYYETKLKFTSIPILNVNVEQLGYFGDEATIQLYSKDYENVNNTLHIESGAIIKTRGATSMNYPKKQYRLSLTNGKNKNSISILGMEKDEDWILDGMYSDYSKIRSKLAFDLWNDINSYTLNSINNDIELQYIDLYINQEYKGLYLLKEVVDRKLLSIDETTAKNSGILIKGNTFDSINLIDYDMNKKTNIVIPFEMKYPNNVEDYSKYWDNVVNKIYNYYFDKEKITNEYILNTFDLYNYIDYKILINITMAMDNFAQKNVFLSVKNMDYDTKVIFTPWDLDITFGYGGFNNKPPTLLFENYYNYTNLDFILGESEYLNQKLKERYFELRESVLSIDKVNSMIDSYYNQIKYSANRDSKIWLESDLEEEINKVKQWYKNRVEYLDEFLKVI